MKQAHTSAARTTGRSEWIAIGALCTVYVISCKRCIILRTLRYYPFGLALLAYLSCCIGGTDLDTVLLVRYR